MPHPAQVSHDQIIQTARDLYEAQGDITMAQLAGALGIKAPSLYKHFDDKNALLRAINTLTMREITEAMRHASQSSDNPYDQCMAMARAYWDYATAHPVAYHLAFSTSDNASPDPAVLQAMALPLQAIFARAIGDEKSLIALRGAWALLHGFVSLYLTKRFQREGDVGEAYRHAFAVYLAGWGILSG